MEQPGLPRAGRSDQDSLKERLTTIPPSKTETVFWQQPVSELLSHLSATPDGLTSTEAADRLKQVGPNVLRPPRKRVLALQFLAKFKNPLVILLFVASVISAFTGDVTSFLIISAIVVMSVTLDFIQEYRAGKAAEELCQSVAIPVQALRDGKSIEIPAAGLVPGDVILLSGYLRCESDSISILLYKFLLYNYENQ
jgi:Mg2+-importing ATPase